MKYLTTFLALGFCALTALAELPRRDFVVELRQIEEGGAGYVVGTQPQEALLAPQQVQVRNGAKATLRLGQSLPVQWVQSVTTQNSALTAGGASASSQGGGVKQGLTWLEAGQSLVVQPRWSGGKQPVALDIELQTASVQAPTGAATLPSQSRSQLVTTVSAPLGQWVTVASTGASAQRGVYGSNTAQTNRRLLQLRVSLP